MTRRFRFMWLLIVALTACAILWIAWGAARALQLVPTPPTRAQARKPAQEASPRPPSATGRVGQPSRVDADRQSHGQISPSVTESIRQLSDSKSPAEERLKALYTLYRQRVSMSDAELLATWTALKDTATDVNSQTPLAADALWAIAGIGVVLKETGIWSDSDMARETPFLAMIAVSPDLAPLLRRLAISDLGELRVTEAAPLIRELLGDGTNGDEPEIVRSGCIALQKIEGMAAFSAVAPVLAKTDDPAVFGTAAYVLGKIPTRDSLAALMENRNRLGDNLSVDTAVGEMESTVTGILKNPTDKDILTAVQATRSLWREDQRAAYAPLLLSLVKSASLPVKQAALSRLLEMAAEKSLEGEKEDLRKVLTVVQNDPQLANYGPRLEGRLTARLATPLDDGGARQ